MGMRTSQSQSIKKASTCVRVCVLPRWPGTREPARPSDATQGNQASRREQVDGPRDKSVSPLPQHTTHKPPRHPTTCTKRTRSLSRGGACKVLGGASIKQRGRWTGTRADEKPTDNRQQRDFAHPPPSQIRVLLALSACPERCSNHAMSTTSFSSLFPFVTDAQAASARRLVHHHALPPRAFIYADAPSRLLDGLDVPSFLGRLSLYPFDELPPRNKDLFGSSRRRGRGWGGGGRRVLPHQDPGSLVTRGVGSQVVE